MVRASAAANPRVLPIPVKLRVASRLRFFQVRFPCPQVSARMTTHTITKGFDLRLAGAPEPVFADAPEPARVVLETAEFPGIKPKVLVKEGDSVKTGQPVFLDKTDRDIVWCSPVTGKVARIDFGERRFLLRMVIENAAAGGAAEAFAELPKPAGDRDALIKAIKGAGLWPLFRQRPGGKMPRSNKVPVAIYCNGMDTAPLAADRWRPPPRSRPSR